MVNAVSAFFGGVTCQMMLVLGMRQNVGKIPQNRINVVCGSLPKFYSQNTASIVMNTAVSWQRPGEGPSEATKVAEEV